jgi:hypothetical protein
MDWFGDYTVPLERIAWGCFESILDLCVVFLRSKGSFFSFGFNFFTENQHGRL